MIEEALRIRAETGRPWRQIAADLDTTIGAITGCLYRLRHRGVPYIGRNRRSYTAASRVRVYTKAINIKVDDEQYDEVTEFASAMKMSKTEAARTLIEWGMESYRGASR